MKRSLLILLCLSCSFFFSCGDSTEPTPTFGMLDGKVTDYHTGNAVVGATVTTEPASDTVVSDASGHFHLHGIKTGDYTLVITKDNYLTRNLDVRVGTGKPARAVTAMVQSGAGGNLPPFEPVLLAPADLSKSNPASVTLKWSASDPEGGELSFDIYLDEKPEPTTKVAENKKNFEHVISDMKNGTKFYWRVVAKDAEGLESESGTFSFYTASDAPAYPADSLILYISCDNSAFKDESLNKFNILKANVATGVDRKGNANSIAYFTGNDSYLKVPYSPQFNFDGDFTISCWIKPDEEFGKADGEDIDILSRWTASLSQWSYGLFIRQSGTAHAGVHADNGSTTWLSSDTAAVVIKKGTWYHLCLTKKGNTVSFYINGELAQSAGMPAGTEVKSSNQDLYIGRRGDSKAKYSGAVDEIRVYSKALTLDEILTFATE